MTDARGPISDAIRIATNATQTLTAALELLEGAKVHYGRTRNLTILHSALGGIEEFIDQLYESLGQSEVPTDAVDGQLEAATQLQTNLDMLLDEVEGSEIYHKGELVAQGPFESDDDVHTAVESARDDIESAMEALSDHLGD